MMQITSIFAKKKKLLCVALDRMPETELKALNIEMVKFIPSLDVSLGSVDQTKKAVDVAATDVALLTVEGLIRRLL